MHKYAQICSNTKSISTMHSYAFICTKYAKICKICKHEIYMHHIVTAGAIPSALWAAPWGAANIFCSHEQ